MLEVLGEWLGLDTTLIVGVLSFTTAALACAVAAARAPSSEVRTWIVLTCFNAVFALDLATKVRYRLHNFVDQVLVAESLYQFRTLPQQIIIGTLACIFLIVAVVVLKRTASKSWPARIASIMVVGFVGFFGIEGISLHDIDRILWSFFYRIKVVGWIWASGAAVITLAALWRAARGPKLGVSYSSYQ